MKSATKGKGRCTSLPGHRCKGYGEELRAPARLRWGGAATTSVKAMETHFVPRPVYGGPGRNGLIGMASQGNRAGGPGVLWTPGRRPPHRNGGTFGSFGHERTTMQREDDKKKATNPTLATNLQNKLR